MLIKLILLFYLLINNIDLSSSKRLKKISCPVIRKCPSHKHKICGSDGKLYNSHCHLKKASCETGILLHPVHADECESIDSNESLESIKRSKCEPKEYDQMKEQILDSVSDVSIFFSQLDENHDGLIGMNELWSQSSFIGPSDNSACLLTDLLVHEDKNGDKFLDLDEFQNAFNTLYSVTMVTLDQSHSVNHIQAHIGDNVEIRCDIVSKPRQPVIKWTRYGVDLSSLQIPNVKVYNDGSIYLANVQLSLAGNYICHAEYNLIVKQVHVIHVISNNWFKLILTILYMLMYLLIILLFLVPPTVEVSPTLQWSVIGQKLTIDCIYENIEPEMKLSWLKNDEPLLFDHRISITRNESRLQIDDVTRSDTGAYTCRMSNLMENIFDQSTSSVIVQKESFDFSTNFDSKKRLLIFHEKGLSVYSKDCGLPLFEMKAEDVLPQSRLTLCGTGLSTSTSCSWSENAILTSSKLYIGQPLINRVVVFDTQKFEVIQVIATDPRPTNLWFIQEETEDQLWILCHGHDDYELKDAYNSNDIKIDWSSSSRDQKRHNKKTVQVIRFPKTSQTHNTIHLQPINGQFDLVYNFFAPKPSSLLAINIRDNNRFAYVTHWDERELIKVDMKRFKYIKTINLADCQPINGVFTIHGFLVVQCQTPVTHQLNGQLVLDQTTDSIISYNPHIKAFKTYLSPNHNFLINVYHNASSINPVSTTIIVQRVTSNGLTFLYDVRTTLNIVNCDFIWKNGNYDALLASGTLNREDLLYLSLNDGRVELISGIGKPDKGSKRLMAVSQSSQLGAISSLDSVFLVNLDSNKIDCEIAHLSNTSLLLWLN